MDISCDSSALAVYTEYLLPLGSRWLVEKLLMQYINATVMQHLKVSLCKPKFRVNKEVRRKSKCISKAPQTFTALPHHSVVKQKKTGNTACIFLFSFL